MSSSAGKNDYSTGIPVGFIQTSVRKEETTDDGRPLAILYGPYLSSSSTVGYHKDEYVVEETVYDIEDKEESKEAGLNMALEDGKAIFGDEPQTITYGYYYYGGVKTATPAEAYV